MHRYRSIFIAKILLVLRQGKTPREVLFSARESGSGFASRHAKRSIQLIDSLAVALQLSISLFLQEDKWVLVPRTLQIFRKLLLP